MGKKTSLIIRNIVLVVLLLVAGIFACKKWYESHPEINVKRCTKCMEELRMLRQKNNKIIAKVDQEMNMEKCIRDYLKSKGYSDNINCLQNYSYSVCQDTRRYNAEIDGEYKCRKERDAKLRAEGYKEEGTKEMVCVIGCFGEE